MRTWAKGSAPAAFLAVGVMAFGSGTALADTDGGNSVGGGNQVNLPVTLPIDISGNAVGVVGESEASSRGGAAVLQGGGSGAGQNRTSGYGSVLGGNQVVAPITAPVNACGNAVAVLGESEAGCKGGAAVQGSGSGRGAGGNVTSGRHSVLGGNQVIAPITAPVNLCGNAVAIFGDATAGCKGGAWVQNGAGSRAGGNRTSGRSSVLGGNQVVAPITAPINVCGNSVAVIGEAFSGCTGGSSVSTGRWHGHHGWGGYGHGHHHPGSTGHDTDGRFSAGSGTQVVAPIIAPTHVCGNGSGSCRGGISTWHRPGGSAGGNVTNGTHSVLGGNQVVAPITAPINVCGNAIAIAGDAFAGCRGGASVNGGWSHGHWSHGHWVHGGSGAGHNVTSGRSSILGGNQVVAPITAPINVCGNAVAVLARSHAGCKGGAAVVGGTGGGGNITSGRHGILAGNQVVAPITAPINVCGNSVAVLGDAAAGCLGGANVGPGRHNGHSGYWGRQHAAAREGMMSAAPASPMLSGLKEASGLSQQMSSAAVPSAPVIGDLPSMLGLPELPSLPTLPSRPSAPRKAHAASSGTPAAPSVSKVTESVPAARSLDGATRSLPVTKTLGDATNGLPTGDLGEATEALPLDNLGLMSAEQPVGLTGMNSGSFAALVLGAMFAASASLFAVTRRFRFGRK